MVLNFLINICTKVAKSIMNHSGDETNIPTEKIGTFWEQIFPPEGKDGNICQICKIDINLHQ